MKKYINKITHIDCLEGLKKIQNNYVDLIITSPPYNLGNNHHTGAKRHKSYNDNLNEDDYQIWQTRVLDECFRVMKKNGSMIYNHKNRIKDGVHIFEPDSIIDLQNTKRTNIYQITTTIVVLNLCE